MYLFVLKDEKSGLTQTLPLNSDALKVSVGANHEQDYLISIGEIVNPGYAKCKTIAFSGWFPVTAQPRNIMDIWERHMKERKVLRLIIVGASLTGGDRFEINLPVVFDKLKFTEKGGEPGGIFYDVIFKEYRSFSLKVIK
ncbi:MAG: hypothetical protein RSB05_01000 [Clostridiales bacterium]